MFSRSFILLIESCKALVNPGAGHDIPGRMCGVTSRESLLVCTLTVQPGHSLQLPPSPLRERGMLEDP